MSSISADDEAIRFVCRKHFHQCFWLPETQAHKKLRVTFSTTSNFANNRLPVAFFCAPMFGGRWTNLFFEQMAVSHNVRVICVDRPGMGGSEAVSLNIRVQVWLETVPALLKHLDVHAIDLLLCHSAGTIYALNTLYYLRELLHSKHPYVAMIAPWVHNEHSQATLMGIVSKLPSGMFDSWNGLAKTVQTRIAPVASWSGGIFTSVAGLFQFSDRPDNADEATPGEIYGTSDEAGKEIERLIFKYIFVEDTTAANEDAKLCSKKCGPNDWGVCWDYEEFVLTLVSQETQREASSTDGSRPKLILEAYFAESDIMIGKGGQRYFEECWRQDGVHDSIHFESVSLPGTNHDSALVDPKKGAMKSIFEHLQHFNSDR